MSATADTVLGIAVTITCVAAEITVWALARRWPLQVLSVEPAPEPAERVGPVTATVLETLLANDGWRCHTADCLLCGLFSDTVGRRP